jgi:hypothetical protein
MCHRVILTTDLCSIINEFKGYFKIALPVSKVLEHWCQTISDEWGGSVEWYRQGNPVHRKKPVSLLLRHGSYMNWSWIEHRLLPWEADGKSDELWHSPDPYEYCTGFNVNFILVPTQTWLRLVTACVCKPEAANTVGAPDDERCTARNMLNL